MPNEILDDRDLEYMRGTAMLYTKHTDKSIQRLGHIVIRLLAELDSLRSQLQQRDAELAERDGRLLAMRELANPWVMYRGWCNVCCNRILGKHEDGCSWAYTSSLAADARRRVEQQALREAADKIGMFVTIRSKNQDIADWLRSRADSLDRPVAEDTK